MKKIVGILVLLFLFLSLTGCGGNRTEKEVIGTWYSPRPDTIIIKEKGTFTSDWITSGIESSYILKDDNIIFTAPDSSTYEFKITKENDKTILYYESKTSSLKHTYYMDKAFVDEMIAQEKEKAQKEKEQQEATAKEETANILVGSWEWVGFDRIIEFTADGKYKFTNYQDNVWEYEVVDFETLKITKDNGESYTTKIKIDKIEDGYELIFANGKYSKK